MASPQPPGVRQGSKFVHAASEPGKCTGSKFFQIESVVIEGALGFGISSEQNLKAAIEQKTIHFIGPNAAADAIGGFHDLERNASVGQMTGAGETGETGADDQHIRTDGHSLRFPR